MSDQIHALGESVTALRGEFRVLMAIIGWCAAALVTALVTGVLAAVWCGGGMNAEVKSHGERLDKVEGIAKPKPEVRP